MCIVNLTRDELRYILDPKEVLAADFLGKTFRVLKDKEERLYGEYRTSRLVLGRGMGKVKDEGGMMKDELGYVHGADFSGEPVLVLKDKDEQLYGEYRTSCIVLRAWERK